MEYKDFDRVEQYFKKDDETRTFIEKDFFIFGRMMRLFMELGKNYNPKNKKELLELLDNFDSLNSKSIIYWKENTTQCNKEFTKNFMNIVLAD